jgi:hypothetical protein
MTGAEYLVYGYDSNFEGITETAADALGLVYKLKKDTMKGTTLTCT